MSYQAGSMDGPSGLCGDKAEQRFPGRFIPLHYHYNMLLDRDRVEAFREAIDQVVRPGAKVLEFGGGTGILSFFAAQKAERVWCVEFDPQLADAAARFLAENPNGRRVEVVRADATTYLPPEPVDVVICEMLHVGLLREKQIAVIDSFKERYVQKFGASVELPTFVPDASLLAFQAVQQSFDFAGYYAPISIFQAPTPTHADTLQLADPVIYATICYDKPLPRRLAFEGDILIEREGNLNAIRLVTKNLLAIHLEQGRAVEWLNQYLIMPLQQPVAVQPGTRVQIEFSYEPGGTLEQFSGSLAVSTERRKVSPPRVA